MKQTFAIVRIGVSGVDQRLEPVCGAMQDLGLRPSGIHWIPSDFQSLVDLFYYLSARTTHIVALGDTHRSLQVAMSALAAWSENALVPLEPAPCAGERFMAPNGSALFSAPGGGIVRTRNVYTAIGDVPEVALALRAAIAG